ncbi:MAG: molybdate ABC transporter substrate-binding protein [Spirochaetes bacterium GWB1_59_5]|nr:MAG: molybdate ABC transporter substrate-binding protein [Spirochaetes bacterium GWB1_59_5]
MFHFAGSGIIRKQIEQGFPADVFFSAASTDMDELEKAGFLESDTKLNLLSNSIVLIGGNDQAAISSFLELSSLLASTSLVAIGNPASVPAGRYAVQALTSLGLYSMVEKKLVLGGNARQVLQYVQSGSVPLGIVFATDVGSVASGGVVKQLFGFSDKTLDFPVHYQVAVMVTSGYKHESERLVEFFHGDIARAAFFKAGFGTL